MMDYRPFYIRYLAATDDSPFGRLALEYLKSLLRIARVRVGSMTGGGMDGAWEHYASLLGTPMAGGFINVVCCDPRRWTWVQRVHMAQRQSDGTFVNDVIEQRIEVHTTGVRNVLLALNAPSDDHQALTAEKYDAIVVPADDVRERWSPVAKDGTPLFRTENMRRCAPVVIPVPVVDHDAMLRVVTP